MLQDFYVYRYLRLDKNTPFYIGKGRGNRFKSLRSRNYYFNNIIKNHPYKVEIVMSGMCEQQAFKKEKEFILLYKSMGYCEANFTNGGEGTSGYKHTDEQRKRSSEIRMGNKYCLGNNLSDIHKENLSRSLKGRIFSDLHKKKISKKLSGRKLSQKHAEAAIAQCVKMSENNKGHIPAACFTNQKKVIDLSTGMTWDSAKEAAFVYCINAPTLRAKLCGSRRNNTSLKYVDNIP